MKKFTSKRLGLLLLLALFATLTVSLWISANAVSTDELYPVMPAPPYTLEEIHRDHISQLASASSIPSAIDRTAEYPRPGNQGRQGSCTAWAVAYAYKTMQENIDHGWGLTSPSTQFSPAFVYNLINRGRDEGSSISEAMQLLVDKGCCTLADMPYNDRDYTTKPNANQLAKAYPHRSENYWSLIGLNDFKNAIYTTGGAVIGIPVCPDFDNISKSNQIYDVYDARSVRGWHAICLIGYDDAKQAFKFVNSWGNWGLDGYGWIAYSLIANKNVGIYGYAMTDIIEHPLILSSIRFNGTPVYGAPSSFSIVASGPQNLRYAYYVLKWNGTGWDYLRRDGTYYTTNTFSYTFTSAGTYRIQGYVMSPSGAKIVKDYDFTIASNPPKIDSIKFNGTPLYGAPSSFSIIAASGSTNLQYAYYVMKWNGTGWDYLRRDGTYYTTNTFSYTFPSAGNYRIQGYAMNPAGEKIAKDYDFTLNPIKIDSIRFNGTPTYGAPSSFSIIASGNAANLQYAYYVMKWNGTGWDYLRRDATYYTTNTFSYTFPSAGNYRIQGYAMNAAGEKIAKDYDFTLNPIKIDSIRFNGTPTHGAPSSFTIIASGNAANLQYAYYVLKWNGTGWDHLRRDGTYYTTNTFSYTFPSAGTYRIQGYAMNPAGEKFVKDHEFTL